MIGWNILADIISSTIIFAMPLLVVALGGMFSERSGTINIALEGIMIIGALASCLFLSAVDFSDWGDERPLFAMFLAILIAAASGTVFALLLAFASVSLKADQTIGGTALNMFAPAFAIVLTWAIQGQGQTTIYIPTWIRITPVSLGMDPGAATGFLGRIIFNYFFLTTPIVLLLLVLTIFVIYKTRFGLRLRSCGEHPQAADSVGINVYRYRYTGVAISGLLGGIGGLAFTIAAGSGFESSVAGYGFFALAVMIFGNWNPIRIFGAALFFALFRVIGNYSSSIPFLPSFSNIKSSQYIYQMLPYVVTMILLIFTSKKSRAPKAEGIPYDKGSR
ncbi:MAG TPA: sugar ABC transporter permease [Clostridiales bacterium]|nr:sugar ABC transporter permease [Clostridiales bacterium]